MLKCSWWFWCFDNSFTSRSTNSSAPQFSDPALLFPLYMKNLCIIPDCPARIILLNPYLWIFIGLYCRKPPILLEFAEIICLSMHCTSSGSTFKQFWHTTSKSGLILNNFSFLFLGLSLMMLYTTWRNRLSNSYL